METYNSLFTERFWGKIAIPTDNPCWLWQANINRDGYGTVSTRSGTKSAHRVAYQLIKGQIPPGMVIRHTCDNPRCCNPAHLLPGTHADNVRDRVERGRSACGEHNGRSKLNWDQVRDIRKRVAEGAKIKHLALEHGVDPRVIRDIRDGKKWIERV